MMTILRRVLQKEAGVIAAAILEAKQAGCVGDRGRHESNMLVSIPPKPLHSEATEMDGH